MSYNRPAEVFPPGEYIKDELEARGWSQADLAEIMGRPPRLVSELISAKRAVTPETARGLGDAFGTGAEVWMNLESAYQLWKLDAPTDTVSRKAKIYAKAPIKEMIRRGWLETSDNVSVLERQVLDFFGAQSIDDEFVCRGVAARKSDSYSKHKPEQVAWFCRAKRLARAVDAAPFSKSDARNLFTRLRPLAENLEDARHIPRTMAECGVRLLVVAPLTGSKVDGGCFWLDERSPVITLSLRTDTIDGLWFTLLHECAHVIRGDGLDEPLIEEDLVGPSSGERELPESEREANQMAGEALIPKAELDNFILRNRPMFYKDRVVGFAKRMHVHPGIVNGQLHYHVNLDWKYNRDLHVKVRDVITPSVLTDGFGRTPPTLLKKE